MTETQWTEKLRTAAAAYINGFEDLGALEAVWAPWDGLCEDVVTFLKPAHLKALPAEAVYSGLVDIFQNRPRMRGRFKALVGFQDGQKLRDALLRLVTAREGGDPGRRVSAMQLGGIGRATATELLCLWWPYRFFPQNSQTCRALAGLVEVYTKRDLAEFPYDAFLDLVATLEADFRALVIEAWPETAEVLKLRRYLYFYAFVTAR